MVVGFPLLELDRQAPGLRFGWHQQKRKSLRQIEECLGPREQNLQWWSWMQFGLVTCTASVGLPRKYAPCPINGTCTRPLGSTTASRIFERSRPEKDQQCLLHKEVAQNCIYLNLCFSPRFGDGFDCAVWLVGWDLPPSHSIQADELADWPHTFILHFELRTIVPQCSRQKKVNYVLMGLWPFQRLFLDYFPALVLLPSCFAKAISEVGLIYLNPEGNGFNGRAREIGCCDWDLPWLAFLYCLHSAWIVTLALMYYEECTWRMHIILIIHIVEFAPIFTG